MCGLVGMLLFGSQETGIPQGLLAAMRDSLSHRGPDHAGIWVSADERVGLAHRRLSIIDLSSSANQPMAIDDGSLHLIFNGEIYNHKEIRCELDAYKTIAWRTDHSDTEVLLRAFEHWGIDCLSRLRGMFVFALWDSKKEELWLVRDRLGIKPLYYSTLNGRFTFASEIKALLTDPAQSREVSEDTLFYYLSFLCSPPSTTLIEGIQKVPPATWLRIRSDGYVKQHHYWDPWDHTSSLEDNTSEQISQLVITALAESIALRSTADVPIGTFLSGGIDSSAVTTLLTKTTLDPVQAFTVGYTQETRHYQNETHFAQLLAESIGVKLHHQLLSADQILDGLPAVAALDDEPTGHGVVIPTYYTSQLAATNGVVVVLVGEGADELFGGYPHWYTMLQRQAKFDRLGPQWVKRMGYLGYAALGKTHSIVAESLDRSAKGRPLFWGGCEIATHQEKLRFLSPRLRQKYADRSPWEVLAPIYNRFQEKAWDTSTLNWMTYVDLNTRLPEMMLKRVDRMTMGFSLEARVPFLDHSLVELALSIPPHLKIHQGSLKQILKQSVRGLIPDQIIDRPKQGWTLPSAISKEKRFAHFANSQLQTLCQETDFFDFDELNQFLTRKPSHTWAFLNFALWWEYTIKSQPHYTP